MRYYEITPHLLFPQIQKFPPRLSYRNHHAAAALTEIAIAFPLPRRCRRLVVAVVSPLPLWIGVPLSPRSPKFTTPIAMPLLTDVAIALLSPRCCRRLSATIVGLSSTFEARLGSTSERLCLLAGHRVRRP